MKTHFKDPCIHCGTPFDAIQPGPCNGDSKKAAVLQYWVSRQAWESSNGTDLVRILLSTGEITEEGHFPQEHWPYSDRFKNATVRERGAF